MPVQRFENMRTSISYADAYASSDGRAAYDVPTPYGAVLRTVGAFLDEEGAHRVTILETADGLYLRYERGEDASDLTVAEREFTELRAAAEDAERRRRRIGGFFGKKSGPYESALLTLGAELESAKCYSVLLDEVDDGFLVTYQYLNPSQGFMVRKHLTFLTHGAFQRAC